MYTSVVEVLSVSSPSRRRSTKTFTYTYRRKKEVNMVSVLMLLAFSAALVLPATASALPAELRHLGERHYFHTDVDGLTSFIQATADKAADPPRRIAEGRAVNAAEASLLWQATIGQFSHYEGKKSYTVGKFIAAGNFGNVYKMTGEMTEGRLEQSTGRVIKQR